jgi:hypothetical protein
MTFRFWPRLGAATLGLLPVVVQAGEPSPAPGINCPAHFGFHSTQWRPFPPCPPEPAAPTLPPPAKTLLHAPPIAPRDQFAQADRAPVSRPLSATVGTPAPSPPPIAPPPAEPRPSAAVVRSSRETGFATIGKPAAVERPVVAAAGPPVSAPVPSPKASIAPVKHVAPRPATPSDDVIRPAWPVIVPTAGSR